MGRILIKLDRFVGGQVQWIVSKFHRNLLSDEGIITSYLISSCISIKLVKTVEAQRKNDDVGMENGYNY